MKDAPQKGYKEYNGKYYPFTHYDKIKEAEEKIIAEAAAGTKINKALKSYKNRLKDTQIAEDDKIAENELKESNNKSQALTPGTRKNMPNVKE